MAGQNDLKYTSRFYLNNLEGIPASLSWFNFRGKISEEMALNLDLLVFLAGELLAEAYLEDTET
jgi:hypothetical protein